MNVLKLNIPLAWERVKKDLRKRNFVNATIFHEIVDHNEEWLKNLEEKFESGTYCPKSMEIIEVPKGKGLIRPGSLLTLEDNIFYTALVQECYLNILERIVWAQNVVDFKYIPAIENYNKSDWYKDTLPGWKQFREKSLEIINSGYRYVILTDITGFYENIDISTLVSDLRLCNVEPLIIDGISKCLNKWCQVSGKGIPQGNSASDLLAKLYLNTVDLGMRNANFHHVRYVDDIRIFCKTEAEAKSALIELSRLLRRRGLNLQSAKTRVLSVEKAIEVISGAQQMINKVREHFQEEVLAFVNAGLNYDELNAISEEGETEPPIEVIKKAMAIHFINAEDSNFDKTFFHFLINKLIKHKESFALDYCLSILKDHPEETKEILSYSDSIELNDPNYNQLIQRMAKSLIEFLCCEDAIYHYQNFLILSWLGKHHKYCLNELLLICRQVAFDSNKPYYYRFVGRDILGQIGNNADLDKLEDHLSIATSEIEKAELLCCLRRAEKSKRNSFYSRISNEGVTLKMAVDFVKNKTSLQ